MSRLDKSPVLVIAAAVLAEGGRSDREVGAEVVRRGLTTFPEADRAKLCTAARKVANITQGAVAELELELGKRGAPPATPLELDVVHTDALGVIPERAWKDLSDDEQRRAFELLRAELARARRPIGTQTPASRVDDQLLAAAVRELQALLV